MAAATPTDLADITNSPLIITIQYVPTGASTQVTTNILSSPISPLLPASFQTALTQSLGNFFKTAWTAMLPAIQASAVQSVYAQASAHGKSVSNVNAAFPTSGGRVLAQAASATSPQTPGSMQLVYLVPGCIVNFDSGVAGYQLSTYGAAVISAAVPWSVPPPSSPTLVPTAYQTAYDASTSNENVWAALLEFGVSLLNYFTFGLIPSLQTPPGVQIAAAANAYSKPFCGSPPTPASPTCIPALDTLVGELNQLASVGYTLGFRLFTAGVINNALTLGFVHPTDPAPLLYVPQSLPTLALSQNQVAPGALVGVFGSNFPAQTMSQLTVAWANTSTGQPNGAVVTMWLLTAFFLGGSPSVQTVPSPTNNIYQFTATGLQPDTQYVFLARCDDLATSSQTSNPLFLWTSATDVVNLFLNPAGQPGVQGPNIGSGTLSSTIGSWAAIVTIPANIQSGDYVVAAELNGTILTTAPITVVGGQPVLHVVDTSVSPPAVRQPPVNLFGGQVFSVQGLGFAHGPVSIAMTLNGQTETFSSVADATGQFLLNLTAPGNTSSSGVVTVTGTGSNGSASTTVIELGVFTI